MKKSVYSQNKRTVVIKKLFLLICFIFITPNLLLAKTKNIPKSPKEIYIMDKGKLSSKTVIFYMKRNNPRLNPKRIEKIYQIYKEEATIEGVNYDVALAQMMLETGFLSYQGDVNPHQFNFAGIGALGAGAYGAIFSNLRTGIRAQIQHLHAYGCKNQLKQKQIDPRYRLVRRGTAKTISDLTGRWAMDPKYANSIFRILKTLYSIE